MDFRHTGYEIFDAHVHPMCDINGTNFSLFDFGMSQEEFVTELRIAGISKCCGSVIRRFQPEELVSFDVIHELNVAALDFRDKYPDFYLPGICVHPKFVEESCREIEDMHRNHGVRLVGELVAYMMCYSDYSVKEMNPVWELIRDLDMTVNLHLNRIDEPRNILANFPDLKLIIAHPTASVTDYNDRLDLIRQYPNAALDISGSGPNSWRMVKNGINRAGVDKILFGTDFPLRNPGMYVAGVLAERLSEEETRAVFSENFRRMLLE